MTKPFLLERLPEYLVEDPFLVRFVGIFQAQADQLVHRLDTLDHVSDPTVAPPEVVRWLGSWLGMETVDPTMPVDRQRALVRIAGRGLGRRGTATGLRQLLEALTGAAVSVTDNGGIHADGEAPRGVPTVWIDVGETSMVTAEHLLRVVRRELPAGVGFELRLGGRVVWPEHAGWSGPEPPSGGPASIEGDAAS